MTKQELAKKIENILIHFEGDAINLETSEINTSRQKALSSIMAWVDKNYVSKEEVKDLTPSKEIIEKIEGLASLIYSLGYKPDAKQEGVKTSEKDGTISAPSSLPELPEKFDGVIFPLHIEKLNALIDFCNAAKERMEK